MIDKLVNIDLVTGIECYYYRDDADFDDLPYISAFIPNEAKFNDLPELSDKVKSELDAIKIETFKDDVHYNQFDYLARIFEDNAYIVSQVSFHAGSFEVGIDWGKHDPEIFVNGSLNEEIVKNLEYGKVLQASTFRMWDLIKVMGDKYFNKIFTNVMKTRSLFRSR